MGPSRSCMVATSRRSAGRVGSWSQIRIDWVDTGSRPGRGNAVRRSLEYPQPVFRVTVGVRCGRRLTDHLPHHHATSRERRAAKVTMAASPGAWAAAIDGIESAWPEEHGTRRQTMADCCVAAQLPISPRPGIKDRPLFTQDGRHVWDDARTHARRERAQRRHRWRRGWCMRHAEVCRWMKEDS
jgi:hypothetical protein